MKRILALFLLVTALLLTACGQKPASDVTVTANGDSGISDSADSGPKDSTGTGSPAVGEQFEGTVTIEGMEETVHYEQIRNDALGFEMGYDMEHFTRRSETDCERFISVWDDPDHPEVYLEITRSPEDAETAAAAVSEALSAEYLPSRYEEALARAGHCIEIHADVDHEGLMSIWELQTVYIFPAEDGCRLAWVHYTMDSADGWGARFRGMMQTFQAI